jgi:hypothetical protein
VNVGGKAMKAIKLGQVYVTETTKGDIPVRLERLHPKGGWTARALTHGRILQIKDESQLLFICTDEEIRGIAHGVMPKRRSKIQGPVFREPIAPVVDGETPRPFKKVKRPPLIRVVVALRLNILDAAFRVLSEAKKAMTTREIVAVCAKKLYWVSEAKTPWQTLMAALNREIQTKGTQSRFKKTGRGLFALQ